jgi:hypothetical protein
VGLLAIKLALGAIMMAGILDALRTSWPRLGPDRASPLVVAAVLVLALAIIAPGATFRPQLATMAGLAVQWALLERASRRLALTGPGQPAVGWELWCVPPLVLVWANVHGGFLVGVALMGIFTAAAGCRVLVSLEGSARARALAWLTTAGLLTAAAPLVNPYGLELYTYLARTLDDHGAITEWRPIPLFDASFGRFKLLVVAALVVCAASWRRLATWDGAWRVGFVGLATALAFRHQRHTVLVGIASAPLLAVLVPHLVRAAADRWPRLVPDRGGRRVIGFGVALIVGIQLGGVVRTFADHGAVIRFSRLAYPVDALSFLELHDFRGNAAVPFDWGSYTAHTLGHRVKLFIDGRFEAVYPPEVLRDYFAFADGQPGWERLLDAYPTDIVVTQRALGTHEQMFGRSDFVYVYSDPVAFVFVRRSPRTATALDRLLGLGLASRPPIPRHDAVFP